MKRSRNYHFLIQVSNGLIVINVYVDLYLLQNYIQDHEEP